MKEITIPKNKMTPETQQQLNKHLEEIAKILYAEVNGDRVQTLEGIH